MKNNLQCCPDNVPHKLGVVFPPFELSVIVNVSAQTPVVAVLVVENVSKSNRIWQISEKSVRWKKSLKPFSVTNYVYLIDLAFSFIKCTFVYIPEFIGVTE